jgi:transcriptional regulator with XRE-family HTH domain
MSQSELRNLLRRVAVATRNRGDQSRLARDLGKISRQRVSEWLTGRRRPSGEMTLQLLKWVTAEEAKQKQSAGSASTRPARKTRKR